MPLSENERAEFESLMSQLDCGGLDDSSKRRLEDLLRSHPDAIERYLDQFEAEAMLQETYGTLLAVVPPVECKPQARRSSWRLLAVAAAIVIVLGPSLWWAGSRRGRNQESTAMPPSLVEQSPARPLGAVVATVTRNSGTQLRQAGGAVVTAAVGDAVRAARYELRGGVLELTYDSGATVILESPASIELQSGDRLFLISGRVAVRCPTRESKGFTVQTPTGVAVDLGTEFAVEVDPNGVRDDEYHVFDGSVVVNRRTDLGGAVPVREGEALRLDRNTANPAGIDVDYQRFIRGFEAASTDYYDQVRSLDPVVYYVMRTEPNGRTLRNEMGSHAAATIHSSDPIHICYAAGFNGGTALHLDGINAYAVAADYPKAAADCLSVVAWVYAESRPSWATIAKNWRHGLDPMTRGQFHFGLHKIRGDFRGSLEAHVNDQDNVEQFAIEPTPLPLNRWHHVAMVADGDVLRLYRNGEQVAATAYNGLKGNPEIKALAIGTKLDDRLRPVAHNPATKPISLSQGFWDGCIDHLAIFNAALTPQQVEELYETGDASMREFRHQQ